MEEPLVEMVAHAKKGASKALLLRLKGFKVVGSMENPPTNP
jgi:GDPmannose 4,6-dehydratase